jgi:adenylate cyclase
VEIGHFEFRRVDTVRVVGKSEPVAVYQLLGKHKLADHYNEKVEEMRLYDEAFSLYYNAVDAADFQAAGQRFQQLAAQQPEDKLYKLYEERCQQLAENPPSHWDGITDMRSK